MSREIRFIRVPRVKLDDSARCLRIIFLLLASYHNHERCRLFGEACGIPPRDGSRFAAGDGAVNQAAIRVASASVKSRIVVNPPTPTRSSPLACKVLALTAAALVVVEVTVPLLGTGRPPCPAPQSSCRGPGWSPARAAPLLAARAFVGECPRASAPASATAPLTPSPAGEEGGWRIDRKTLEALKNAYREAFSRASSYKQEEG